MRAERIHLTGSTPGVHHELTFLHFGDEGARPKAYIQAGLHADESPGMLCATHLRAKLEKLEADGLVNGHIVLVPAANPIGMAQLVLGSHHGRFSLADGVNFNRAFPELADEAAAVIDGQLGADAAGNDAVVRTALLAALMSHKPRRPTEDLKLRLLSQAIDADTVLDLHCDGEAVVHLYTLTPQVQAFEPLAAWLGAEALLHAAISGDHPFDEAVSRPWRELTARFTGYPLSTGPIAATVELRGEADVSHGQAGDDAQAILSFLAARGHVGLDPGAPPPAGCQPTPLEGSEALESPAAGLIVYRRAVGETVRAGDLVVEIVDPLSGHVHPVLAQTSGVFYARTSARFATAGRRLGKIAGKLPFRTGNLLSP